MKPFSYTTVKARVMFLIMAFKFNRMRKVDLNSMKSQYKSLIKMKMYVYLYANTVTKDPALN